LERSPCTSSVRPATVRFRSNRQSWSASAGWFQDTLSWLPGWGEKRTAAFRPFYLAGVDPLVWGFLVSLLLGVGVSAATRPDAGQAAKYFPE